MEVMPMNELYHHGIKGMHWGVRRYQNSDGTLTAAGKKRYDNPGASAKVNRQAKRSSRKSKKRKLTKDQKQLLASMGLFGASVAAEVIAMHAYDKYLDDQKAAHDEAFKEAYRRAEEWEKETRERARRAREAADEAKRQYYDRTGGNASGSQNGGARPRPKQSTADTKSRDRVKNYEGVKLDPKKTQARVNDLRQKVAKAQRDGTLTPEMVDELQEAMAANKAAKANMAHSFGCIYRIRRDPDALYHYGIKGMHWGIRRYQNPDGTLTAAGKRREQALNDKQARRNIKRQREWNAKNASRLSDKELNDQINRLQKERQLQQLTRETVNPGRKKASDMLDRYGNQLLATVVGGVATGVAMRYVNANMDVVLAKRGYKVKGYNPDGTPNYGNNSNDDKD